MHLSSFLSAIYLIRRFLVIQLLGDCNNQIKQVVTLPNPVLKVFMFQQLWEYKYPIAPSKSCLETIFNYVCKGNRLLMTSFRLLLFLVLTKSIYLLLEIVVLALAASSYNEKCSTWQQADTAVQQSILVDVYANDASVVKRQGLWTNSTEHLRLINYL